MRHQLGARSARTQSASSAKQLPRTYANPVARSALTPNRTPSTGNDELLPPATARKPRVEGCIRIGHPIRAPVRTLERPPAAAKAKPRAATFAAHGAYGMSVVTGLTAQNTVGVRAVSLAEPALVAALQSL